jgi:hypothetical protein
MRPIAEELLALRSLFRTFPIVRLSGRMIFIFWRPQG